VVPPATVGVGVAPGSGSAGSVGSGTGVRLGRATGRLGVGIGRAGRTTGWLGSGGVGETPAAAVVDDKANAPAASTVAQACFPTPALQPGFKSVPLRISDAAIERPLLGAALAAYWRRTGI